MRGMNLCPTPKHVPTLTVHAHRSLNHTGQVDTDPSTKVSHLGTSPPGIRRIQFVCRQAYMSMGVCLIRELRAPAPVGHAVAYVTSPLIKHKCMCYNTCKVEDGCSNTHIDQSSA